MDQAPDPVTNTENTPPPAPAPVEVRKGPAYGSILGIVLIVAILILGAFYVWGERIKETTDGTMPEYGVRGEMMPSETEPSMQGSASVEVEGTVPEPI